MNKFKSFLTEKGITEDAFKEKSTNDVVALYNEFNEKNALALQKMIAEKDAKNLDAIKEMQSELAEYRVKQAKVINDSMKELGLQIKKLSAKDKADGKGIVNSVFKELSDRKEQLMKIKEVRNERMSFKAASTMLLSANVSGGNVPVEQRLEGLNRIPNRKLRFLDVIRRASASSNLITWVYQANRDGSAGQTAEGASKQQIDFDLVVDSEKVKKTTAFIKVSTEMIDDVAFIESEIRNELRVELLKKVEEGIYDGDGTGEKLNGIRTVAVSFAAGDFASTVENPNSVDVLTIAQNQIEVAEQEMATYCFVHPNTITELKLIKNTTTDRRYVGRLEFIAGQLMLDGMAMVTTTLVDKGEYLIGNFDKATCYDKGEVDIEIGRDGNDFTKNLITILAEWRGLVLVKNNDRSAFVKGDFATDIEAIKVGA